jgi:fructoselysine-6-P-deglycase FrlB-like protein
VITKQYVARQVAVLLEFAKSTKNAALSAALVDRAADLKLRSDDARRHADNDLAAPDVELGS